MTLRRQPPESRGFGLYLHVPFCRQQCSYCDFFTIQSPDLRPAFVDALVAEVERASPAAPGIVQTVYLGGGTPSLLTPGDLERILTAIRARWQVPDGTEVSLEGDPGDLTTGHLAALRALGVNRLSLGLQTLDDDLLALLRRCHDARAGLSSYERARAAGFDDVSVDLVYALPGQGRAAWAEVLGRVADLGPDHLSCYELTFEPGTILDRQRAAGRVDAPDEDARRELFAFTSDELTRRGFEHYEVSSFASSPARRSRHNSGYWVHRPYLGLGPSAHSFDGRRRWWNHRSMRAYLGAIEAGRTPVAESETLTDAQLADEAVLLGLRTTLGFPRERVASSRAEELERLASEGYVTVDDDRVRPTRAGLAIADELARRLVA